jgi:hypothetical protein
MRRYIVRCVSVILLLASAACAINDDSDQPVSSPVTLNPPPTAVFAGDCNLTPDLSTWLQAARSLHVDFQNTMLNAAIKGRSEMRDDVLRMASLRDRLSEIPAPDCGAAVHGLLLEAMGTAVTNFQSYINGDRESLGTTVDDVRRQFDQAVVILDELTVRLDQQYLQVTVQP